MRTRTYLVEGVDSSAAGALVRMACLDDDAQGQPLETIWGLELDREILDEEVWKTIGKRGFDPPKLFRAYLHTLRWHCVTATNPSLFQAPFRAGIRIDAYQLEPLRKSFDYAAAWLREADPAEPQGNKHTRAHMYAVMEGLKKHFFELWSEGRLGMIPVGDVLLELDKRMRAGLMPEITNIGEFSTDGGHLRSGLPRYTLAATYYAVLFRDDPVKLDWRVFQDRANYESGKYGFYVHQPDLGVHLDITPERAKLVNETIWTVVREHPYARVGRKGGGSGESAHDAMPKER